MRDVRVITYVGIAYIGIVLVLVAYLAPSPQARVNKRNTFYGDYDGEVRLRQPTRCSRAVAIVH